MHLITDPTALTGQNFHGYDGAVITIGNFDGLHLGHRALLKAAGQPPGPRVVITFAPHPVQVLYPERGLRRLLPREDLREQLPALGIDLLVELPFTREFASLTAPEFLNGYLSPFKPSALVVGYDFAFGKAREGKQEGLRAWCDARGTKFSVVPPFEVDGAAVSSRRLRDLVERGEVGEARRLLGRPYYLRGLVGSGAGRGAGMGSPTLNQAVTNETLPKNGVYVSRARWRGEHYDAVTNVGLTPTFGASSEVKIETHVLDQDLHWRDQVVDVDLLERLRDERKFDDVAQLRTQIATDIARARQILAAGAR